MDIYLFSTALLSLPLQIPFFYLMKAIGWSLGHFLVFLL